MIFNSSTKLVEGDHRIPAGRPVFFYFIGYFLDCFVRSLASIGENTG
mgnify:CR=1 FL=1